MDVSLSYALGLKYWLLLAEMATTICIQLHLLLFPKKTQLIGAGS
jgi:hypothetical protein